MQLYIFICVLLTLAIDLEFDLNLTFQLADKFCCKFQNIQFCNILKG